MPFTPFHLGPGAAFKAAGGGRFSFMVFGGSQVLMDIEPLVRIIRGDPTVHGLSHTIAGAFVIGSISVLMGKPISDFVLRRLRVPHAPMTWWAALWGGYIGTFSHIVLDAVVHPESQPWWPFFEGNALLGVMSVQGMHW